jgi:hypothetical protein
MEYGQRMKYVAVYVSDDGTFTKRQPVQQPEAPATYECAHGELTLKRIEHVPQTTKAERAAAGVVS